MTPRPEVAREMVQQLARRSGLELTPDRADELAPQLQEILEGLRIVEHLMEGSSAEPAPVFRTSTGGGS